MAAKRLFQRPKAYRPSALDDTALHEHRTQASNCVQLCLKHNLALASPRIKRKGYKVQHDMLRQIPPEERGRHVLDEGPNHVPLPVIDGEVTSVTAESRADVAN